MLCFINIIIYNNWAIFDAFIGQELWSVRVQSVEKMYVMVVKFVFPFLHVQFSKKFQWKGRLRTVINYNKEISLKFEVKVYLFINT